MRGLVVALSSNTYSVVSDGVIYHLLPRGLFRAQKIKPIVGDIVEFDIEKMTITSILERKTLLKRPQIANISQIIIVESIVEPEFSLFLFLKYLVYAKQHHIPAKLIVTKMDMNKNPRAQSEIESMCYQLGVQPFFLSLKSGTNIDLVKSIFAKKITCLIGQSGVGKSSLLNAIDPSFNRQIGEYSSALGRGKHQTKEVILLPYENGYIADTPGFSSLELDMQKSELAHIFHELYNLHNACKYSDCLHLQESECAVKEAIDSQKIPIAMYNCYCKLVEELDSYRRF